MRKTLTFLLGVLYTTVSLAQDYCDRDSNIPRDTSFTVYQTYIKERKYRPYIQIAHPQLPDGVVAHECLVYSTLTNSNGKTRELHLNIYRPKNEQLLPALLMVHGGGWNSGDLSLQIPMAQQIAAHGYVTVPVEYRLIPEALYPAGVNDLRSALRWLRANAARFGIDTTRIAISGCSAGGQLANLIGMANGKGDAANTASSQVQAVVNIDGLSDFTNPETVERARLARANNQKLPVDMIWLGGNYQEQKATWEDASPIYHVSRNSAPVCFINSSIPRFHAGRDEQIHKLDSLGIYSEVHTLPDTPHPFWLFHPWFSNTVDIMTNFLDKVFKNSTH